MSILPRVRAFLILASIALCLDAFAAHARLGFSFEVETDGMFSTTLKQVTVSSVVQDAPAQRAGLMAQDRIDAVNGLPVAGSSGGRLKEVMEALKPGDHLLLTVRRKGAAVTIDIVAGDPA